MLPEAVLADRREADLRERGAGAVGVHRDGIYHDTHDAPVLPEVLALVEELFAVADAPGVLLERDGNFPPHDELAAELHAIAAAAERGSARAGRSRDAPTRALIRAR